MSKIKLKINGIDVVAEQGDTILQAAEKAGIEIPTLCHNEMVKVYGACGMCVVEAEGNPKLLRSCSIKANDGMVINTNSPRVLQSRKIALELLMSDHDGDCKGPCMLNCPANTECQKYVNLIGQGKYNEAVKVIKEKLPLPASIGRVCPHPCEDNCRRNFTEEPLAIANLKFFAADYDLANNTYKPEVAASTGKTVAVIGGGPAGLTTAYFLAVKGHKVTIFDKMPKMGGMLRYGIPEYRLPKAVLDKEIKEIADLGVEMKNNIKIGEDVKFEDIKKEFDATVVAIGAWTSSSMRVKGEDCEGVVGGIDFLRELGLGNKPTVGEKVAVVGGGNTAMDACRTAVRLGAKEVYVLYRRTRDEMPAAEIEIEEAEEEGVIFKFLSAPVEFTQDGDKVIAKIQKMELGEPDASGRRKPVAIEGAFEELILDKVIMAIGQIANVAGFEAVEMNKKGIIAADENTFVTSMEGVFAVGDCTNKGAGIAIAAIGEANKASEVVDSYLNGATIPYVKHFYSQRNVTEVDFEEEPKQYRVKMRGLTPEERKDNFKEIVFGYTEEEAKKEANRCLECGCHDFDECKLIRYSNSQEIHPERFKGERHHTKKEEHLVVIERNNDKCVLCGLCVRICNEVAGEGILGLMERGFNSVIKPEFDGVDIREKCGNCLKCAENCPTGALRIIK